MDNKITQIADGFVREAAEDYVGLWAIVPAVKRDLGLANDDEIKSRTLDVVRALLGRGLFPGDYLKSGFSFWQERDSDSIIARIKREWELHGTPVLGDASCWFAKTPQHG
jgi:hypothetical protein